MDKETIGLKTALKIKASNIRNSIKCISPNVISDIDALSAIVDELEKYNVPENLPEVKTLLENVSTLYLDFIEATLERAKAKNSFRVYKKTVIQLNNEYFLKIGIDVIQNIKRIPESVLKDEFLKAVKIEIERENKKVNSKLKSVSTAFVASSYPEFSF